VVASDDSEYGYNFASQDGGDVENPVYQGKDEDGGRGKLMFSVSIKAGQMPRFVFSQNRF